MCTDDEKDYHKYLQMWANKEKYYLSQKTGGGENADENFDIYGNDWKLFSG